MKNKFKLLVVFVLLLLPCVVMADMAGPSLKPYEMVVVAQDGIDYYDYQDNYKGHLNKDEKVTITLEYGDSYSIKIGDDEYAPTYKLKDLTGLVLLKEEVTPDDLINEGYSTTESKNMLRLIKEETSSKALVYAEEGVDIRKGPSVTYDKVAHLDKNKVVNYSYALGEFETSPTHIYVDVDGVKGWIEILNGKVLVQNTKKYITYKEVEISCTTIPKDTVLSPKYISDAWTRKVLVEYGGCEDMVNYFRGQYGITSLYNKNSITNTEIDIYAGYNQTGEKLATIPADGHFIKMADVSWQGEEDSHIYVNYNGITGWVKTKWNNIRDDEESPVNEEIEKEITIEEDEEETKSVDTDKVTNPNPVDYISMYVIIGLSVAIIALIIIILINRKKKVTSNQE